LSIRAAGARLCDGRTRRQALCAGGLGLVGLALPQLLRRQAHARDKRASARSCILLWLMGGPPQHSTWDPKPNSPAEVRGEFKPIATTVPGLQISELLPGLAQQARRLCLLRAVSTGDNAHSSSGYYLMTGQPHQPMNFENAKPGAPNNWPTLGAVVQHLSTGARSLPAAVRLPQRIFNTDSSVWPGQDAGFLGRKADPWLLRCQPAADVRVPELTMSADVPATRFDDRHALLTRVNERLDAQQRSGALMRYDRETQQAFDLLRSAQARQAFDLEREPVPVRDRYGRSQFGQSVLLARRLVEAGVSLVQVNWYRGPDEPPDNPCWDSHAQESARLKTALAPPMDCAFSALLEDLSERGMLDETLVVCLAEFGRTPRMNARGGRDHWGSVFSVALAGGGVRGGHVHGASDAHGGQPKEGQVLPHDLTATIFRCLGHDPHTEIHDTLGRPVPISRGRVTESILG
jgi:hypothetical protein